MKNGSQYSALNSLLNSKENTAQKPLKASHHLLAKPENAEREQSRNLDLNALPNLTAEYRNEYALDSKSSIATPRSRRSQHSST